MPSNKASQAPEGRLRVVYSEAVATFSVAANATLADIAWTLHKHAKRRYGAPLAIDVILASRNADAASRISRIHGHAARSAPNHNSATSGGEHSR